MDEHEPESSSDKPDTQSVDGSLRSPIRPTRPQTAPLPTAPAESAPPAPDEPAPTEPVDNPEAALENLRRKMEHVANEYAAGRLNRAQFNAIYGRYGEQRTIIERLLERNPRNRAWQQVAAPGHTSFLMEHFAARIMYYAVYRLDRPALLMIGGPQQPDMNQIEPVLHTLLTMPNRPHSGLARKSLGDGQWLVLALGAHTVTFVLFMLEPSAAQINRVRDLHADFERANRLALERDTRSLDRMVFPQRALVE
jgi:hypothetical protein